MKRTLPPLGEPFPPAFHAMLLQVLRHAGRMKGARIQSARARHQVLQQSGTFTGHRPYARGDDLRRVDWNAYARTGSLFLKVLAEEEARAATLLLDVSPSMRVGQPPRWISAVRLAAVLGGLALVSLDGVTVHAGERVAFHGKAALHALLEHLRSASARAQDPLLATAELLRHRAPARVHWISDFVDVPVVERVLLRLRRAGARVTGWLPTLPDDFGVEVGGWCLVCDPETGESTPLRVDAELAAAMRHELQVLHRQQQQVFAACGFPLQRLTLPADDAFEAGAWMEAGWGFRR